MKRFAVAFALLVAVFLLLAQIPETDDPHHKGQPASCQNREDLRARL